MDFVISFSPDEEQRIVSAAKERGVTPEKMVIILDSFSTHLLRYVLADVWTNIQP